jgi:fatty-acyl-CoA synthase
MACIILKEGVTATVEEIKESVKTHMAKHKVPKYVEFVTGFPMNAAGKIMKYKMREAAVDRLNLHEASKIETA